MIERGNGNVSVRDLETGRVKGATPNPNPNPFILWQTH